MTAFRKRLLEETLYAVLVATLTASILEGNVWFIVGLGWLWAMAFVGRLMRLWG